MLRDRIQDVEIKEWPSDAAQVPDFLDSLSRAAKPVVLRNTPANNWAAVRTWTPNYIQQHIPLLNSVQVSSVPGFFFLLFGCYFVFCCVECSTQQERERGAGVCVIVCVGVVQKKKREPRERERAAFDEKKRRQICC